MGHGPSLVVRHRLCRVDTVVVWRGIIFVVCVYPTVRGSTMQLTLIQPAIISIVFGLVVGGVYILLAGPRQPWSLWQWLAYAWVLACLCFIILFGVIKV